MNFDKDCNGSVVLSGTEEALTNFEKYRKNNASIKQSVLNKYTLPKIFHDIAPSIDRLTPTSLEEIASMPNKIHKGRVLFGVTVGDSFKNIASYFLLKDNNEQVVMTSLYNFIGFKDDPKDVFPEGTYIALLEPYLVYLPQSNPTERLMLRCDNPQCVIRFNSERSWLQAQGQIGTFNGTPTELRLKGNEFFRKGQYILADAEYSEALEHPELSSLEKVKCLANRAETNLRRERFERVEEDCLLVLKEDEKNLKAMKKLAVALLYLNRIQEAGELFMEIEQYGEANSAEWITTLSRLEKESAGNYSLQKLPEDVSLNAEFSSDLVSFRHYFPAGDYTGCSANNDIPEGTLLCASSPFVTITDKFGRYVDNDSFLGEIMYQLSQKSELAKKMYGLQADGNINHTWNGTFCVSLLKKFMKANQYGSGQPFESIESQNIEYRTSPNPRRRFRQSLFYKQSMFNHSCTPNCNVVMHGKFLFVFSTKKIEKGKEICTSFVNPHDTSYLQRTHIFSIWYGPNDGFTCRCKSCCFFQNNFNLVSIQEEALKTYKTVMKKPEDLEHIGQYVDEVISKRRRLELIQILQGIPKDINTHLDKLYTLHGAALQHEGYSQEAEPYFTQAADLIYAIEGTRFEFGYTKALLRMVAVAASLKNQPEMICLLEEILRSSLAQDVEDEIILNLITITVLPFWMENTLTAVEKATKLAFISKPVWKKLKKLS